MKKRWRNGGAFALLVIVALAVCACGLQVGQDTGSLGILFVDRLEARTIVPDIPMSVDHYRLLCGGPNSETVNVDPIDGSGETVEDLAPGVWTVEVWGVNSEGIDIGYGTADATIVMGNLTTVIITVTPSAGTGTLNLEVGWDPPSLIGSPSIEMELERDGTTTALTTTQVGSAFTATDDTLATGYYLLFIRLFDGLVKVWDHVEAVRIVHDETTSWTETLVEVYPGSGSLLAIVNADMHNPIDITFSGIQPILAPGTEMTVTATPSQPVSEYQWYRDGQRISGITTDTHTFGSNLGLGQYRMTVVVSRGPVLSSENFSFEVGGLPPTVWSDPYLISNNQVSSTSSQFVVDHDGYAHAVWEQPLGPTTALMYGTNADQPWSHFGPGALSDNADVLINDVSDTKAGILVDSVGGIHVCFYDSGSDTLHYIHKDASASGWPSMPETITSGSTVGDSEGAIAVDEITGVVHIAYTDGIDNLYHAHNTGGVWQTEPVHESSVSLAQNAISIAVDANGYSYICYDTASIGLHYATNVSGSWVITQVDPASTAGNPCDLALDSSGNAHIAYHDSTGQGNLMYASNATSVWVEEPVIVGTGGGVGAYCDLAVDPLSSAAFILYEDATSPLNHGVSHVTNSSGSWFSEMIDINAAQVTNVGIAIDGSGYLHVCYSLEQALNGLVYRTTAP